MQVHQLFDIQGCRSASKRILAAFMFFTRLPFWRLANVEARYFERIVPLWPLVGWLTGGVMALVAWCAVQMGLSLGVAVGLALVARVLVTGALHEDGFADFCDGFGGGTTRERTLEIMKDSHIGTYGVLGLVLYFLLLWNVLLQLHAWQLHPLLFVAVDAASKAISSSIIYFLPYARKAEEAKARIIYLRPTLGEAVATLVAGFLPMLLVWDAHLLLACLVPAVFCAALFALMKRRIQGYTGDCCGATFIMAELVYYLSLCLLL